MELQELKEKTIAWGKLHQIDNLQTQALKVSEEWGETVLELNHNRFGEAFEDGIGDVLVALTIFADVAGKDITKCWEKAYNTIKDRTGTTQNGNFIKDEVVG